MGRRWATRAHVRPGANRWGRTDVEAARRQDARRKGDRALNRKMLAFAASLAIVVAACGGTSTSPTPAATAASTQSATAAPPTTAAPVTLTLWHNYGTEANAKV